MTRTKDFRTRAGITLIELLLAIVVMVTLVSTSVPPIVRQITHSRVNRAATLFASELELALSLAGRQRKPIRVSVDTAKKELLISDRASGTQIVRRTFGNDSEFKLETLSSSATIDIMPQGVATGSVTYTTGIGSYTRTVSMTRAGLVRVQP